MAANAWQIVNSFKYLLGELHGSGQLDLLGDTFKCMLLTTEFTPATSSLTVVADITSGIVTDADYAEQTLSGITWSGSGGTFTFGCNNISFGTSATISAKHAVIYDDTMASTSYTDAVVAFCNLSSDAGGLVSSTNGSFQLQISSGIFSLS